MSFSTFPYEASYRAAYIVVALLYGGYALSLWLRARRARARLAGTPRRETASESIQGRLG